VIALGDKDNNDCEDDATNNSAAYTLQGIHRSLLREFLFFGYFPDGYRVFSRPRAVGIIEIEYRKGEKSGYNRGFAWRTRMRFTVMVLSLMILSGCTALVVGGGTAGGYQSGKDERTSSVVASDSAITSKIKGKYAADSTVSVFNIGVRTYEGTVFLSGAVDSFVARDQAVKLAKQTSGVTAVNSQIVIEDLSK
jgi:hypothetical protein